MSKNKLSAETKESFLVHRDIAETRVCMIWMYWVNLFCAEACLFPVCPPWTYPLLCAHMHLRELLWRTVLNGIAVLLQLTQGCARVITAPHLNAAPKHAA